MNFTLRSVATDPEEDGNVAEFNGVPGDGAPGQRSISFPDDHVFGSAEPPAALKLHSRFLDFEEAFKLYLNNAKKEGFALRTGKNDKVRKL